MHTTQDRRISLSTLRRALSLPAPKTERQKLAIKLVRQYQTIINSPVTSTPDKTDATTPGPRTSVPIL